MNRAALLLKLSIVCLASLLSACDLSGDSYSSALQTIEVPSRATFKGPALMMMRHCGTLDCHGSNYRNFRLYGKGGRRLDPSHHPDAPETTAAELDADFDAVISVEPELMSSVIAQGGRYPGVLSITRKGRGEEAHKGGAPISKGDASDLCWTSWLKDDVDTAACAESVVVE